MSTNFRSSLFLRITIYYAAVFVAILLITKLAPKRLNYLPFGRLQRIERCPGDVSLFQLRGCCCCHP